MPRDQTKPAFNVSRCAVKTSYVKAVCSLKLMRGRSRSGALIGSDSSVDSVPGPKRLLFVCVENSNRSQMAEAFARIHGRDAVEVYSAGSRPSGEINPKAIEAMRRIGYDLSPHRSTSLAELPDIQFDFVATMGCGDECPSIRAKRRENWNIPDPRGFSDEEFSAVRDRIEAKVLTMLRELRIARHRRWET